ncbi:DUF1003 domain-containing protein [Candidatus Parcubacteria bacterium]|nr:MAG: DUF1003 domain-containing protein [Candidatus Parcubacteria bacterium]
MFVRGFLFYSKKCYNLINLIINKTLQMSRKKLIAVRGMTRIKLIDSMNNLVGSWIFLVLHVIWFWIWLAGDFDINMLTMIVSLEAIILMILLLMAQNKLSLRDNARDEADFQADLGSLEASENILKEIKQLKKEIRDLKDKK